MPTCEICPSAVEIAIFEQLAHRFVRCGKCGLERISPQPSDEILTKIDSSCRNARRWQLILGAG